MTPNQAGVYSDILLGYDDLEGYLNDVSYMGAVIGRYANRIKGAALEIDGVKYDLSQNEGSSCHHGGKSGFNRALWDATIISTGVNPCLQLERTSEDGEGGFPGELKVRITYTLNDQNELTLEFQATTDKKTVISLTTHPYFNLSDNQIKTIDGHLLELNATEYLPIDSSMIPTGELRAVQGSPFDFLTPNQIGSRMGNGNKQLSLAGGYDHCYVINQSQNEFKPVAKLCELESGRSLTISSNSPGLQLYSSNYLSENVFGKGSKAFNKRMGVCLEPQHFPNAPNESSFPSSVISPDIEYHHKMVLKFGLIDG